MKRTCLRAGANPELAEDIASKVEREVYEGISTQTILELILSFLEKNSSTAMKYTLKKAIMNLGPTGFPFEKFVARLLQNYGYETKVGTTIKGKCVPQEVDVIANKEDSTSLIECKFHNAPGIYTGLKVMMYTYARFLDLKENFNRAWLVCNTKCSSDAKKYAKCMGIKVTSWDYPKEESLRKLVEKKNLYPVTILKSVKDSTAKKLLKANIVLAKEMMDQETEKIKEKTKISGSLLEKIKEEAEIITTS